MILSGDRIRAAKAVSWPGYHLHCDFFLENHAGVSGDVFSEHRVSCGLTILFDQVLCVCVFLLFVPANRPYSHFQVKNLIEKL